MPPAPLPPNEAERLAALRSYDILDTVCEDTFDDIARLAAQLTDCPIAVVSLVDAERQWFKAHVGLDARETPRDMAFCAHAILDPGQPLAVTDATRDPRFADNPLVTGAPDIRAYLGVPLVNAEGQALGTLCVIDTAPHDFDMCKTGVVRSLARTVVTTLELRRAMIQVRSMALTDALTGLPNRPAFREALSRAIARHRRDQQPFSLLYMDLDGFKRVNDVRGHAEGDRVLAGVAEVLRASLRQEDVPARIGGDEFAAVLVGGDGREIPGAAERVRRAVRERMDAHGWPVSASIGAVLFRSPPDDEEEAIAAADELMYGAKAAGRDRVAHGVFHRPRPRLAAE
ncbi:sensor domain-containing diguanylate cyclase [Falsiroseomonas sp. CW058]|uniref:sensor domain-containing diguanylate cyclase n=1 Tax=Falsiroseomonas sp. CW058 TaxID=3388664 RepID=UPI003D31B6AD